MRGVKIHEGFSKLSPDQKIDQLIKSTGLPYHIKQKLKSFRNQNEKEQGILESFSENTISNFHLPFGIAPNFYINRKHYFVPMVIEESSVVAAASAAAKFWAARGGFRSKVISTFKSGQVHFRWKGNDEYLANQFPFIRKHLEKSTEDITASMEKRGGGIREMKLVNKTKDLEHYYQLDVLFETVDSMGANFINTCLERIATSLKNYIREERTFRAEATEVEIIMAILSNYTPECLVETFAECTLEELDNVAPGLNGKEFAAKFKMAIDVANADVKRAVTHNKGIFNGIDSVVIATGNDFRAIEAGAHAWASRTGHYKSLTSVSIEYGSFVHSLKIPLALGTVGGLTRSHPLANIALEILGNPPATILMQVASAAGLANNFSAIKSLITSGIQKGHMKLHLSNILHQLGANEMESAETTKWFQSHPVSHGEVKKFLDSIRQQKDEK